jgi:hypothetical protein
MKFSVPTLGRKDGVGYRPGGAEVRPQRSAGRRLVRFIVQRVAILMALMILYYATSLHGVSVRTFILAGALILFLYWLFKDLI